MIDQVLAAVVGGLVVVYHREAWNGVRSVSNSLHSRVEAHQSARKRRESDWREIPSGGAAIMLLGWVDSDDAHVVFEKCKEVEDEGRVGWPPLPTYRGVPLRLGVWGTGGPEYRAITLMDGSQVVLADVDGPDRYLPRKKVALLPPCPYRAADTRKAIDTSFVAVLDRIKASLAGEQ